MRARGWGCPMDNPPKRAPVVSSIENNTRKSTCECKIQLRTSLRKCLKNGVSKGPRWLYQLLVVVWYTKMQFSVPEASALVSDEVEEDQDLYNLDYHHAHL